MFYSKWNVYQNIYLSSLRRREVKRYLIQVKKKEKPLFIHINRTGGSSIAHSLGITEIHLTLAEYEDLYFKHFKEELPGDTEIWAAIRNPFDKVVSQYFYRKETHQNKISEHSISFEEWIKKAFDEKSTVYRDREIMFQQHVTWLQSENNYKFNFIRFENLEEDYKKLASKFQGLPLVWKKKSEHKNYKELFSKETRGIIEKEFSEDLSQFNYSF